MKQAELQINKIAQGFIEFNDGIKWFAACSLESKNEILLSLSVFLAQVHPAWEEIEAGIKSSGLKSTVTPCVLMIKKSFKDALAQILKLPENEWEKSFILWISIFRVADKRRRETECFNGCTHEWHNIESL